MLKRITLAIGLLLAPTAALAQSSVLPYYYNAGGTKVPVGSSNPLPISGSFSASLAPFTPGLSGARATPITVTVADSSGNLPTNTGSVIVYNVGANPMYCNVNGIAATVADQYISSAGGWFNFGVPAGTTTLHCIATGGSTTANAAGGTGLGAGTGVGSGGGGGGGAITAASGSYASGALSSGSVASGAYASGSISSGAVASGAFASGALASGAIAAGAQVDLLTMRGTKNAGTAASNSMLAGGVFNNTPLTLTDTQQSSLQLDANGYLKTTVTNTNTNGQAAATSSSPVVVAKNSGTGSTIAGAAIGTAGSASTEVVTVQGIAAGTPIPTSPTPYPQAAVPYTATATGTTAATTATLAGAASVTTYICGFSIRANATAAATGNATVTGVITATLNFTQWTAPNASGLGITEMIFSPCIPASAANTSVAVVSAAPGTGGVVSVTAWGYKL